MQIISEWLPAAIMALCALLPLVRGVSGYTAFMKGAKEGALAALGALPALVGMLVCVRIWSVSGVGSHLAPLAEGFFAKIGVPTALVPLIFLRPVSGSGSLGLLGGILGAHGPDGFVGRAASVLMGCTETFLYTATVYYGASGRRIGPAMLGRAAVTQLAAVACALTLCRVFF